MYGTFQSMADEYGTFQWMQGHTYVVPCITFAADSDLATLHIESVDEILPEAQELRSHGDFVRIVSSCEMGCQSHDSVPAKGKLLTRSIAGESSASWLFHPDDIGEVGP